MRVTDRTAEAAGAIAGDVSRWQTRATRAYAGDSELKGSFDLGLAMHLLGNMMQQNPSLVASEDPEPLAKAWSQLANDALLAMQILATD